MNAQLKWAAPATILIILTATVGIWKPDWINSIRGGSSRLPATTVVLEPMDASENELANSLNEMILDIDSAARVDTALAAITKAYEDNPDSPVAQLYYAASYPLPLLKGSVYRLRALTESVDFMYILAMQSLRQISHELPLHPVHLRAIFDYLTDPNPGEDLDGQKGVFRSIGELQDYLAGPVSARLTLSAGILQKLTSEASAGKIFLEADSALAIGRDDASKIPDRNLRFKKVMGAHLQALTGEIYHLLGLIQYGSAYDLRSIGRLINTLTEKTLVTKRVKWKKVLKTFGIGSGDITVFDIRLQSPKMVGELLRSRSMRSLFTLRKKAAEEKRLERALGLLRKSAALKLEALEGIKVLSWLPNQDEYVVNARVLINSEGHSIETYARKKRLLDAQNPVPYQDLITGDGFDLYIPALFDSENPRAQDLKSLTANSFRDGKERQGQDRMKFSWNYRYHEPTGWPYPDFGGLLPGSRSTDDLYLRLKALSRDPAVAHLAIWLRLFR